LPRFADDTAAPRRTGTRAGRNAVVRRRQRTQRMRYAGLARILATVAALTLCVFVYLALMANVTRMNYELMHDAKDRARLLDETARLDDRIARLEARERLAHFAVRLHMREAQTFAQVTVPPDAPEPGHRLALLDWLR
jgi:heme exporter protein D